MARVRCNVAVCHELAPARRSARLVDALRALQADALGVGLDVLLQKLPAHHVRYGTQRLGAARDVGQLPADLHQEGAIPVATLQGGTEGVRHAARPVRRQLGTGLEEGHAHRREAVRGEVAPLLEEVDDELLQDLEGGERVEERLLGHEPQQPAGLLDPAAAAGPLEQAAQALPARLVDAQQRQPPDRGLDVHAA